ncbi:MAG: hypothetical protein ACYCXF_06080 [Thermoleophilia bacterium]
MKLGSISVAVLPLTLQPLFRVALKMVYEVAEPGSSERQLPLPSWDHLPMLLPSLMTSTLISFCFSASILWLRLSCEFAADVGFDTPGTVGVSLPPQPADADISSRPDANIVKIVINFLTISILSP